MYGPLVIAQEPIEKTAVDLPTQRRLQLPEGELPTVGEQVRLLQQLRDRVSLQADPSPPLTEQQLRQMEQIFRRWKSESAEGFQLPDLASIPQEWIEQAIADPQVRQQAERLLEQYAHERQKSASPTSADKRSPGPQGEPGRGAGSGFEQNTQGLNPSDRTFPDAAKIKSLQKLFKKLTDAEATRMQSNPSTPRTTSPTAQDRSQPRAGLNMPRSSANAGSRNSQRELSNKPPNNSLNRNSPNRYLPRGTDSNKPQASASGARATPGNASQSGLSEQQQRDLTEQNPNATGSHAFDPATPEFAAPKENGGNNNGSTGNAADKPRTLNSEETSDKRLDKRSLPRSQENSTLPALRPERSAKTSSAENSPPHQAGDAMDVKSQIERHGVGATLQRIFKNAMSEQKTYPSNEVPATPMTQAESRRELEPPPTSASVRRPIPQSNTQSSTSSQSSIARTQRTVPNSAPTVGDNMRELALEIWQSISTVTQVPPLETASNPAPDATASASESLGLTWRDSSWLLLVLAVLTLLFLAFAGRRMQLAATHRGLEAGWTAEILRAGIRTRSDVIRAFHHFALHRPQPVATWWNHRYVARRLSESSPQLSTAIQELTGLYEFARYQRPELQLSPQQLLRVQTALQQFDA